MKLSIQLGFLSASNVCLAFVFQWYVLTQLGPGSETDALFAGMTVPQLVLAVISGSLMHVLVPLLSGEGKDRLRHDAWGFLVIIGGVFGLLAALLYFAAPWWVPFIVPGFSESGQLLTIQLTRIQLIGMLFAAINGVQWAAYHARQQFLWAELTPIVANAASLLLLVWALPLYGVYAAAWIVTLRLGLQTLLLSPGMGRPVLPDLRSTTLRNAWLRIKPLLLGTTYYKTDPLVDRYLLSSATSGSLSLYYLAQKIYGALSQILNTALAAPLVPKLSILHKAGDKAGFLRAYNRKIWQVGAISLGCLLALGLFGQGVLELLIGHGNVSADNVRDLWLILIWLGGMFVGSALGQITSSSFFALGDTSTPTRLGIFSYTFYIPAKLILYFFYGPFGLALATSLFYLTNFSLQHHSLKVNHFRLLS